MKPRQCGFIILFSLLQMFFFAGCGGQERDDAEVNSAAREMMVKQIEWKYFSEKPAISVRERLEEEGIDVKKYPMPGIMRLIAVNEVEGGKEIILTVSPTAPVEKYWEGKEREWVSIVKWWYLTELQEKGWDYRTTFLLEDKKVFIEAGKGDREVNIFIGEARPLLTEVVLLWDDGAVHFP